MKLSGDYTYYLKSSCLQIYLINILHHLFDIQVYSYVINVFLTDYVLDLLLDPRETAISVKLLIIYCVFGSVLYPKERTGTKQHFHNEVFVIMDTHI